MNHKPRLGRGLAALLGPEEGGSEASAVEAAELLHIPVDEIDANPFQPRREFDEAEIFSLADSIRQHGMLQPVLVRPVDGRYQLIAGERRLRASKEAQLHAIPARVMPLDDRKVCELAMIENLQREDLNAIEKATAFRNYLDTYGGTQDELAGRLGLERPTVANLLRLLNLPEPIRDAIRDKKISPGHGRALLGVDDSGVQETYFHRVLAESLSVRQTESLVATGDPGVAPRGRIRKDPPVEKPTKAPYFSDWEGRLKERFGIPVNFRPKSEDRGSIVIEYSSKEELERVLSLMHS